MVIDYGMINPIAEVITNKILEDIQFLKFCQMLINEKVNAFDIVPNLIDKLKEFKSVNN